MILFALQNPYASDAQDFSLIHSVDEWLASIKMSRYSDNFRAAGVLDMDAVAKMSLQQVKLHSKSQLQGDPSGLRLYFGDIDLSVPLLPLQANLTLLDLQQLFIGQGSELKNQSQQNVVANVMVYPALQYTCVPGSAT